MPHEYTRLLLAADAVVAMVQNGELFADIEPAKTRACAALDELDAAADECRAAASAKEGQAAATSAREEPFMSSSDVKRLIGISQATLYKWIGDGYFPKSVQLGASRVGWIPAEVRAWMAARIAERDKGAAA